MAIKYFFRSCLIVFVLQADCANILAVFPFPSISHQIVFRKLTQELIKHDHEVTVITTDPEYPKDKAPVNLIEIDVHNISYEAKDNIHKNHVIIGNNDAYSITKVCAILMAHIFETQLNSPDVHNLIFNGKKQYDLILIESMMRPALAITHVIKAPVILVSSLGTIFDNNEVLGALTHPILYPIPFNMKIYNLNFWERLDILYNYFLIQYEERLVEKRDNLMLQKYFGPSIPPYSQLYNNVHMLFLNVHSIWADNQPVPPSVVYLGGIHRTLPKELPKDLKDYLDSSDNGVIYVSFGTNALSTMIPENVVGKIAKVLSELSYDVLWKWDQDKLPIKSNNIKTSKWFPQASLLKHPKIKLFITQAGLQSTDEAISAGVPLIAMPMLGDQSFNAEKYVKHGIGKKLSIKYLDPEVLRNSIETVINDKSYRENVKRLRGLMLDEFEPPLKRAMWWIEHVLRHGGARHLRAPTANITLAQYYEINDIIIAFLAFVTLIVLVIFLISFIYRFLFESCFSNIKIKTR